MQHRKWKKVWKDRDFIILASKPINEKEFVQTMQGMYQKFFGVPKSELDKELKKPIGDINE